jgi:fructose-bisphosphate aldolase class II
VGRLGRAAGREPHHRPGPAGPANQANIILEVEIGVVGGEEDGVANEINEQALHDPRGRLATVEALGLGENGRYMAPSPSATCTASTSRATSSCAPRSSSSARTRSSRPRAWLLAASRFDLVFHGGSGSLPQEISDAVDYGVVKMNVDTDTQYAFTRPVADWMLKNYDGVLKVDGEVGNKKQYDPRARGARHQAEAGMAARVVARPCAPARSIPDLRSLAGPPGHGNRGFLRALAALARAARVIGESEEEARCAGFLRESSREAADALGL